MADASNGIKFGIRIPPCAAVTQVAEAVRFAESNDFDVAWIADSQLLWRDVYGAMAIAATKTDEIHLATAVTNFQTRHPSVVASAINTIEEIAPGRSLLGVGSGDSSVKPLSIRPSTLSYMRESIDMTRRLLAGERYEFGDRTSRLRDPQGAIPIHLAASGPRTLELGGEIADGIVTLAGISPEPLIEVRKAIQRGCERAGRTPTDIELTVGAFCQITDDIERDAWILKPICFHIASIGGQSSLLQAGIDLPPLAHISDVYPDMVHAENWDLAVERSAEFVTDGMAIKFAQAFCLFGTVDEILERIDRAVELGATGFYLRHVGSYTLPWELIEAFGSDILPKYAAAEPS